MQVQLQLQPQLLLQPQWQPELLPQPQLLPLLSPQQQIRMMMRIIQRQEQLLFPLLLKHMFVTSL